jgi:hypothetical protein
MIDDPRSLSAHLIAASPLSMSIAEARAQTQDRRRKLLAAPSDASAQKAESDFAPSPLPIVDSPHDFAADFFRRLAAPLPSPPKPMRRPGRKPTTRPSKGELDLRIIDGGKDPGVDKPNGE